MLKNLSYLQYEAVIIIVALLIVGLVLAGTVTFIKWIMESSRSDLPAPNVEWNSNHPHWHEQAKTQTQALRQTKDESTEKHMLEVVLEEIESIEAKYSWQRGMRDRSGRFISKRAFDNLHIVERAQLWAKFIDG